MVMAMHTKDTIVNQRTMLRETMTGMDMSVSRHPVDKVRVAMPIAHNDKLKAVDTTTDRIPRISTITRVIHNTMTMSSTMNRDRHKVPEGAVRHITCLICLMARSRQ